MRALVEELCSDECAGRAPGTPGGDAARAVVLRAFRDAGLDPHEQTIPRGANVLATIPGERYVLVAAHFDHLGKTGNKIFRGADDNAAAVAILVDVARALAKDRPASGVIVAAFDAEEPPHFLSESMGSEYFARHPTVPLDRIDMMVCMDLVGHALGDTGVPAVSQTLFALGAERSVGTAARVDSIAEPGVIVRRADAEIIPPLSDYAAFWDRSKPFVFLTAGRSRRYHTPDDTPEHLDWNKMAATARWLERFVRDACTREPARFIAERDDLSTLDSLIALLSALNEPRAQAALAMAKQLRNQPDPTQIAMLVGAIESALS
jgi:Zn-dependent M28 family amino/carboxypeptidase